MSVDPEATPPPGNSAAPEAATEVVDYEKRFTDTQAAYTQSQQALKDEQRVWEDEQAFLTRAAEKFPHLMAEDEEIEEEPEAGQDPRVDDLAKQQSELLKWQQQVEADRAQELFNKDLTAEAADREVSDKARDWIAQRTAQTGSDRDALSKAAKEWFEFEDSIRGPEKRPRAPHVPAGGQAATGGKSLSEMSDQEALRTMVDRLNAEAV